MTWSFLPEEQAELFGGGQPTLELANPISIASFRHAALAAAQSDRRRRRATWRAALPTSRCSRSARPMRGDRPEDETLRAAGVRRGMAVPRHWHGARAPVDLFDAKADALAVLDAAGGACRQLADRRQAGRPGFIPAAAARSARAPRTSLAAFGEIHPQVLAEMDVTAPLVGFEIDPRCHARLAEQDRRRAPRSRRRDLMPVKRDFAFVVDDEIEAADVVKAAGRRQGADHRRHGVRRLRRRGVGAGKKSLAIEVTLQPRARR